MTDFKSVVGSLEIVIFFLIIFQIMTLPGDKALKSMTVWDHS